MAWIVEEVPGLRGFTVEHAEPGNFYLSQRNRIYQSADLIPPFRQVALILAPAWKQGASRLRLAQQLLRFMVTNIVPLDNGDLFVTCDKSVGLIHEGRYRPLAGLERPCRVLRSACAVDHHGHIFFGEYLANDRRGAIRIYRYRPGDDRLQVVFTFPAQTIKHIHGVYFDACTKSLFCLTGDKAQECQIVRSSDGFKTTEVVGQGDETWRAVSMLFDEGYLYFGTDAVLRSNHLCRVDRVTLERRILGSVDGTVFYSKQIGRDRFFSTTAESKPGRRADPASIWHVGPEGTCEELVRFTKDYWHATVFMFGTIHFPSANTLTGELYFSVVGVRGDGKSFRLRQLSRG